MRNEERHLSDEELVLVTDDEYRSKTARVRAHLEGCAECRKKAAGFEAAITRILRVQRRSLDSQLPLIAGPRAMLRARMSEMTAGEARRRHSLRLFAGAFCGAALVSVMAVAGMLVVQHSASRIQNAMLASSDHNVLPNRDLTPGAVRRASLQEICALPHEEVVKDVSPSLRQTVLEEYGIPAARAGDYEVDYLITPGLGGDDDIRNLWPEPYHSTTWNAHVKDVLEERLHEMVCAQQLDLVVAQKAISTDWIAAYQTFVQRSTSKM